MSDPQSLTWADHERMTATIRVKLSDSIAREQGLEKVIESLRQQRTMLQAENKRLAKRLAEIKDICRTMLEGE